MTTPKDRAWITQALLGIIMILMSSMLAMGWARFDQSDANVLRLEQKVDTALERTHENRERLRSLETIHEREHR